MLKLQRTWLAVQSRIGVVGLTKGTTRGEPSQSIAHPQILIHKIAGLHRLRSPTGVGQAARVGSPSCAAAVCAC